MRQRFLAAFRRDPRGIAAIEFAAALPVLIGLSLSAFEVGWYALLNMKLQHTATAVAELATMDELLPVATLDDLFSSARVIVEPFPFTDRGRVIVSGIGASAADGTPMVSWQRSGGGSLAAVSAVGVQGEAAAVPAGLDVTPLATLVSAEVVYTYEPILLGVVPRTVLRKSAFYRPRFGTLQTLT